jgi:hypothetical protein
MARDGRCEMDQCEVCLRRTNSVQVPLMGAGAQIGEAAVTSATKIISSHGCEDSCMKEEQRRAFAGERKWVERR